MPNVELHVFHRNDLNGDPVFTITDEDPEFKGIELQPALNDLGSGEVRLSHQVGEFLTRKEIGPEAFVRVIVHAVSSTRYAWGFFLVDRRHIVLSTKEEAGKDVILTGPGPLFYLDTVGFWHERFSTAGGQVDLANGVWRFPTGANAGRVLSAMFAEDEDNQIASTPTPFLPALTRTFDVFDDSSSTAWVEDFPEELELRIGETILNSLWSIQDAVESLDVSVDLGSVGSPQYELSAYDAPIGTDRTSTTFAAGKVLWKAGVNIATNLESLGRSRRKASHVLVIGDEGSYAVAERPAWDPGEYTRAVAIEHPGISNVASLERRGKRFIRTWDEGEDEIEFEIIPGFTAASGLYFPDPDAGASTFWLGDSISLKTGPEVGSSPLDYHYSTERVTGIRMELGTASLDTDATTKARSWHITPELNVERGGASSPSNGGGGAGALGCNCIKLCGGGVACSALLASEMTAETTTNGDAENGSGTEWSGGGYTTGKKYAGAQSYQVASAGSASITYDYASQVFTGGTRYVFDIWRRMTVDHNSTTITAGVDGVDEASETYTGVVGSDPPGLFEEDDTGADGQEWNRARVCWTPTQDRTGVTFRFVASSFGTSAFAVDELALYSTEAGDDLIGTEGRAARCDHNHHAEHLKTGATDTDLRLAPDGTGGVEWAAGGGGGAPTTADYLVGTANAGLSAEIVVGTTPGGELGGTWASPTVDATHSGSTHSAATDTHIADTSAAHVASSIGFTPTGTIAATDVQAAIAEVATEAGSGHTEDHAARHADAGADELDVTALGGYTGSTVNFLRADGTFASPAAGAPNIGDVDVVIKDADESVNNTGTGTTLQDDDELFYAILASERWYFETDLWFEAATTPDIKFTFTVPAGASINWADFGLDAAGAATAGAFVVNASGTTRTAAGQGIGTRRHILIRGWVECDATPGNLQLQWAQNSTSALDTVVCKNSTLLMRRIG